jgi:Xaa-Pro aminopeptidase
MTDRRIESVLDIIRQTDLDACILRGMENIFYLSGFRGSEGALLVTKGDVLLLTDFRYILYAQEVTKGRGITTVELKAKKNTLGDLCGKYGVRRLGFDSLHTTYYMYDRWKETVPAVEWVPLGSSIEEIRKCKDPGEIDSIRKAIDVSTKAFTEVYETIRPGRREKDIANDLEYAMRRLGADGPSFSTIVASGPRAALPHAEPTDREIGEGEVVIVDFGVRLDGYCTDETCTLLTGELNGELQKVFSIVDDARKLGLDSIKAGMSVKELDMVVRGFIDDAGYGEFFGHGTGHGVGIAVHEAPAVNSTGEGILEENMIITVEPGIYIPHLGGVRLEDMVLVTRDGATVLTKIRKDMLRISA